MTIREAIAASALVAIDTSPFIYYIEDDSPFDLLVVELFEGCIRVGRNPAVTTVVTLAEVLVGALTGGRQDVVDQYRRILGESKGLTLLPISPDIAERAAELRARYRLRLPDAFQIGAALVAGANYFIINDVRLHRVTEIEIVVLAEMLRGT